MSERSAVAYHHTQVGWLKICLFAGLAVVAFVMMAMIGNPLARRELVARTGETSVTSPHAHPIAGLSPRARGRTKAPTTGVTAPHPRVPSA